MNAAASSLAPLAPSAPARPQEAAPATIARQRARGAGAVALAERALYTAGLLGWAAMAGGFLWQVLR